MDVFKGEQHHSSDHPGPDALRGQEGRGDRLEQLGPRHLRGAVGGRRRRDDGAAHLDLHRALGLADGASGSAALYSQEAVDAGVTTEKADTIFASLPYRIMHEFQIPLYDQIRERDADFYERLEKAGFDPRLRRGRLRPVHEVPAPRVRLLHRRRRLGARGRRRDQAPDGPGRPPDRGRRGDGGRHRAAGGPRGVRDRLRLDERLGWPT